MSKKDFNEIELKSKTFQGHLNNVCLWTEKEFIELMKYNINVPDIYFFFLFY